MKIHPLRAESTTPKVGPKAGPGWGGHLSQQVLKDRAPLADWGAREYSRWLVDTLNQPFPWVVSYTEAFWGKGCTPLVSHPWDQPLTPGFKGLVAGAGLKRVSPSQRVKSGKLSAITSVKGRMKWASAI